MPEPDQLTKDRNLFIRVETYGYNLRGVEVDFLESCAERLGKAPGLGATKWLPGGQPLTPRQRKWLEDIDNKSVP